MENKQTQQTDTATQEIPPKDTIETSLETAAQSTNSKLAKFKNKINNCSKKTKIILLIALAILYTAIVISLSVVIDRNVLAKQIENAIDSAFTTPDESSNNDTNTNDFLSTTDDTQETEQATEESSLTPAELDAQLAEQPVVILDTRVLVQSETLKLAYPDLLSAVIKNNSNTEISSLEIGFVAWDENNLPIQIKGQYNFYGGQYLAKVNYDGINLLKGETFGEEHGLVLDEETGTKIKTIKAIVISYTDFDGNTWRNPLEEDFRALYVGQRLS